tara:strand:+ start:477 stop:899 length:423 start_codon:yes stop_codon:yes gene_type:complete
MNDTIRNAFAVLLGIVIGGVVNMGLVLLGPMLIPPPAGVDMTTVEGMSAGMDLLGPQHFLAPFLAHALGTFAGALVASLLAVTHRLFLAYTVGVFYLFGGMAAATMIPAPLWFILLDLIVAYIPMAWLALRLANFLRPVK